MCSQLSKYLASTHNERWLTAHFTFHLDIDSQIVFFYSWTQSHHSRTPTVGRLGVPFGRHLREYSFLRRERKSGFLFIQWPVHTYIYTHKHVTHLPCIWESKNCSTIFLKNRFGSQKTRASSFRSTLQGSLKTVMDMPLLFLYS